ncbi:MAG: type II toxin-antitoxin system HipA family toxin [bacterium]
MNRTVHVSVDLDGIPHLVGRLWTRERGGREGATFEYAPDWLAHPRHFALEPALTIGAGPHHTTELNALFGALSDSAPDRWGRALMRRADRRACAAEGRPVRTLLEIDYLLRVHDVSRLGALRFAESADGPFLAEGAGDPIPPLVALPRLLAASEHVMAEEDSDEDLRLLLAPGSSLGGARPKASVLDSRGTLCIAKFPSPVDEWATVLWEAVALSLAGKAGMTVPSWSLETVAGKKVLIVDRFDRRGHIRIPFLSAMSMLGAQDHQTRCYLEMADALRRWGASPREDLKALFRRIVFNVLISNTDDHLRNHGFLFQDPAGWRLAPAYDLNPMPVDVKPRVLCTEIEFGDASASLDLALRVAEYFEVKSHEARQVVREVGQSVASWRKVAVRIGIPPREIERMASAFEHSDLAAATRV